MGDLLEFLLQNGGSSIESGARSCMRTEQAAIW